MKKLISLLLLVCLIFGLIACSDDGGSTPKGDGGNADGFWSAMGGDNNPSDGSSTDSPAPESGDGNDSPDGNSTDSPAPESGDSNDSPDDSSGGDTQSGGDWLLPDPEPEPIDPSSKILPDLGSFLMCSPSTSKDFGEGGRQLQWNGSYPYELYESTKAEIIDLLLEPKYQLTLRESKQNPHYSGTVITDIFFDYTGTCPDIAAITDEHGENTFHLRLRVTPYEDYGYFKINIVYAIGFVLEAPEGIVSRDITPGGDMRWLNPQDENRAPDSTDSVLIPCLEEFLYRECTRTADHYAYGDLYGREEQFQNLPLAAYETVKGEIIDLLLQPLFQLKLIESRENAYYDLTAVDFYFEYVGSSENITPITDKYEQKYTFDLMVRFLPNAETDKFQLYLFYNQNFGPTVTSYHTTRDVSRGGDGSELPEDYQGSTDSGDDWNKKCSSCHGSGKCTHCSGKGEVRKFQAGLGWVELDCTLCNSGKCRHCNGTGKDR
ncbi:MAG: zinc finger-like domain-containing protein [Clostridia bacterium]|nr:zinc finger-like domain-containing protein [Clostridia bacterium]